MRVWWRKRPSVIIITHGAEIFTSLRQCDGDGDGDVDEMFAGIIVLEV